MPTAKPLKLSGGKKKQFASADKVPAENLGSGTASNSKFLRGDQQWEVPSALPALFIQTADQEIVNTGTETSILGSGHGTLELPAGFFTVGKSLRISVKGFYSNLGGGDRSISFNLKLGGTTINTSNHNLNTYPATEQAFEIDLVITCRTTGATGTVVSSGMGRFDVEGVDHTIRYGFVNKDPQTVDTTGTLAIALTGTWGEGEPANTITSQIGIVQELIAA